MATLCITASVFEQGGYGRVISETSKRLKNKIDVSILTEKALRPPPEGINLFEMKAWLFTFLPIQNPKLVAFLKTFDVIHSHDALPIVLATLKAGKRPIITCHGNFPWKLRRGLRRKFDGVLHDIAYAYFQIYHKARIVIAISKYVQRELKQNYGINSIYIPNGVDLARFKPLNEKSFVNRDRADPILLYVGSFYDQKGVDKLILAMPDILKQYPKATLNLIGYGPLECKLRKLARNLGLLQTRKINFLGSVSDESLPYYYNACDIFLTASLWESFGLPLLEAMACGTPVVARNQGAMAEHVNGSKAGELFDGEPDGLVKAAFKVLSRYERYQPNARPYASKFSWDRNVSDTLNKVYKPLLEGKL